MKEQRLALVIEDDQDIAISCSLRLQGAGYETMIAASAEEGLIAAVARRPDVIILDIRLPNMDGLGALRALAKQECTRHIPVIALSACLGYRPAALKQGARYFLKKPCKPEHLIAAVQATIGAAAPGPSF